MPRDTDTIEELAALIAERVRPQNAEVEASRIEKLEKQVGEIQGIIDRFTGAMNLMKWLGGPLIIGGVGVLVFFLGRCTNGQAPIP